MDEDGGGVDDDADEGDSPRPGGLVMRPTNLKR